MLCISYHNKKMKICKQGTKIHSSSRRSTSAPLAPISVPLPCARETRHPLPFFPVRFPVPGTPSAHHLLAELLLLLQLSASPLHSEAPRSASRFLPQGWPIRGNRTAIRKPLKSLATDQLFTSLLGQSGLSLENKKQDRSVPKKISPGHKRVIKGCQIHELS